MPIAKLLAKSSKASILEATKHFDKELSEKETYVHRKYYEMKEELKGVSLSEVKERFGL